MRARQRRQLAAGLIEEYRVSKRKACSVVLLSRTVFYYGSRRKRDDTLLRQRMKEIAGTRVRYGFQRIHVLLRREGFTDNHKRTYRTYFGRRPQSEEQATEEEPSGLAPA